MWYMSSVSSHVAMILLIFCWEWSTQITDTKTFSLFFYNLPCHASCKSTSFYQMKICWHIAPIKYVFISLFLFIQLTSQETSLFVYNNFSVSVCAYSLGPNDTFLWLYWVSALPLPLSRDIFDWVPKDFYNLHSCIFLFSTCNVLCTHTTHDSNRNILRCHYQ